MQGRCQSEAIPTTDITAISVAQALVSGWVASSISIFLNGRKLNAAALDSGAYIIGSYWPCGTLPSAIANLSYQNLLLVLMLSK